MHVPSVVSQELVAAGATLVAFAAVQVRKFVLSHVAPKQLATLHEIASVAVKAAEQFGDDHGLKGDAKLQLATAAVVDAAKRVGLKVTDSEVNSFIHSALADFKDILNLTSPPVAPEPPAAPLPPGGVAST